MSIHAIAKQLSANNIGYDIVGRTSKRDSMKEYSSDLEKAKKKQAAENKQIMDKLPQPHEITYKDFARLYNKKLHYIDFAGRKQTISADVYSYTSMLLRALVVNNEKIDIKLFKQKEVKEFLVTRLESLKDSLLELQNLPEKEPLWFARRYKTKIAYKRDLSTKQLLINIYSSLLNGKMPKPEDLKEFRNLSTSIKK